MDFTARYVHSLGASNLMDDAYHVQPEALAASGFAGIGIEDSSLPALLCRVKYADGTGRKQFEANAGNLAQLLRIWRTAVQRKGEHRGWVKSRAPWDVEAAHKLYSQVAEASLAYWMDGRCEVCNGADQTVERRTCQCCKGSGRAEIARPGFVGDRIKDMVAEIEDIVLSHNRRAAHKMRKTEFA